MDGASQQGETEKKATRPVLVVWVVLNDVSRRNHLSQLLHADVALDALVRLFDDEAGFVNVGSGLFKTDRRALPPFTAAALRSVADFGRPVTYTCVPPGSGERVGVNRGGEGFWHGDERQAHTGPGSRP